ncbi:MAG: tannase/feruloyl esterase family alpha/beta hydrolase [Novosphingobium sp.]
MMRRAGIGLGAALLALTGTPARAGVCDGAAQLQVADVRIDRASEGPGGAYCRIEGRIEKEIGFELWLPENAAWNRRLLVGGVGGQAGSFNQRELARGAARGYASASTDTGHKASDTTWLLRRPDRAANYAHRANHLLAVKAKALIARFYGRTQSHAFFVGCSGGGRQAMTELQRYPADFDGIIAGAPGVNTPQMSARRLWEMQRHSQWGAAMPAWAWTLAHRSAIAQCDGQDGVKDGVVDDPRTCAFDPASLLCKPGQDGGAAGQCLGAAQVAAVRQLQAPLFDENGRRIDGGLLPTAPVSPAPLPEPFTPGPSYLATVLFAQGVHGDANWDARRFSLASDLPAIDRVMNLHADDPAIEPFIRRGGKLIVYQGWDDPLVSALPTLDYWQALERRHGAALAHSARLYMVPGMDHCRGGPGADLFGGAGGDAPRVDAQHDLLSALERWVLEGRAPDAIVATKAMPLRTRLLCPWPAQARFTGAGNPDFALSYVCRKD